MDLRILGWKSKGLRCANVSLKFNPENRVDFIQMNNGVGKTTTLNLIRAALTGEKHISLIDEKSKGKNDLDLVHELLKKGMSEGKFILDTIINDDKYTFIVNISRCQTLEDSITFDTSSTELGGENSGWTPPQNARPFLTKDFIQLCVFDGERQGRILDKDDSIARRTISTLCQFNILEEAKEEIKK